MRIRGCRTSSGTTARGDSRPAVPGAGIGQDQTPALAAVWSKGGLARAPIYVQRFFERELGFADTAVVFNLAELLSLAASA